MTIAATGDGFFHCMCDDCYRLFGASGNSFGHMIQIIRRSAWVAHKNGDGDDWQHRCSDCISEATQSKLDPAIKKFS